VLELYGEGESSEKDSFFLVGSILLVSYFFVYLLGDTSLTLAVKVVGFGVTLASVVAGFDEEGTLLLLLGLIACLWALAQVFLILLFLMSA